MADKKTIWLYEVDGTDAKRVVTGRMLNVTPEFVTIALGEQSKSVIEKGKAAIESSLFQKLADLIQEKV